MIGSFNNTKDRDNLYGFKKSISAFAKYFLQQKNKIKFVVSKSSIFPVEMVFFVFLKPNKT